MSVKRKHPVAELLRSYKFLEERLIANKWISTESFYNGTPCWRWFGSTWKGYPIISIRQKNISVHRIIAFLYLDLDIDNEDIHVCHHCDVRDCWNPGHLFVGSSIDNMQDCVIKKRHRNSKKTHCKRGHELTADNLVPTTDGSRQCKICHNERSMRSYNRKKAFSLSIQGGIQ